MTKRGKKLLSLLLASAMVFTMNTTVFAEEVAVDSAEDAAEAAVDSVDETDGEAAVDAAVDGKTTYFDKHCQYTVEGDDKVCNTVITYAADPDAKDKNKEDVATIKNVDSCVSWANVFKGVKDNYNNFGYSYNNPADHADTDGGQYLISAVLSGSNDNNEILINDFKQKVSCNGDKTNEGNDPKGYLENVKNKVTDDFAAYKVIDLGDKSHYLFVGYGNSGMDNQVQGYEGLIPVFEYDGRQIEYNNSGKHKSTSAKNERLDVAVALVEYKDGTLTEIPGVTVGDVKMKKGTGKDATVSGQMNEEKWSYESWSDGKIEETRKAYKILGSPSSLGSFTLKANITSKLKKTGINKVINKKLKDIEFPFAIRQHVVSAWLDPAETDVFTWKDGTTTILGKVSGNKVYKNTQKLFYNEKENEELEFDVFTISKFDQKKDKATLDVNLVIFNGKTYGPAQIKLKQGEDYEFTDGNLAGENVKVLNFKKNFVYADSSTADDNTADKYSSVLQAVVKNKNGDVVNINAAPYGYKWAFRQTPPTDTNKKPNTFRYGFYKDTNDGLVYSLEDEAAADSVEEAF